MRFIYSLPYSVYFLLISLNVTVIFVQSTLLVWRHIRHYILGGTVLLFAIILTLKLISYHFVNQNLWFLHRNKDEKENLAVQIQEYLEKCPYPSNLTLKNVIYFWVAPTLCYQTAYPRTPSVRKTFVLKRIVELFCCLFIQHVLLHQFTLPEVQNSVQHLLEGNHLTILENILAISSTTLYCWLLMFFAFFQAFLNMLAELLRFGDREFYQDWWNASSLGEYWRLWNSPMHKWFKRHVYIPLRFKYGVSPPMAQILVFSISAILHEYVVAVPTHIVKFWSFWAIFSQVPLILISNWVLTRFPNSSFGNYFFWFILCIIGQPMCFVLYYKAAMSRESPNDLVFGLF
jgi:diacylglycerol O-acyltransferase-1